MDLTKIADKLVGEHPWLYDYIEVFPESIDFYINDQHKQSRYLILSVYTTARCLHLQGCIQAGPDSYPSKSKLTQGSVILMWFTKDESKDYQEAYKKINNWISTIKTAIDYWNSIDFVEVRDTLNSLGFERKNEMRWDLTAGDLQVEITGPCAHTPCFEAYIKRQGTTYRDWVHLYGTTIEELLNEITKGE